MSTARVLRLDRLLANLGYGSRREIQSMARNGRITQAGMPLRDSTHKVALTPDLAADLRLDDVPVDPLPGLVLMMNKPVGVTCSHKETGPLVYGLLPERWRRRDPPLSSVGRLDKDTSGLLLLTDDGALLHRIIAPRHHMQKRYIATLEQCLSGNEAEIFASGTLHLHGEKKPLLPAILEPLGEREAMVTLVEGRYHQIRRMFAACNNYVVALRRIAIGPLSLPDDLEPGAYVSLDDQQRAALCASS